MSAPRIATAPVSFGVYQIGERHDGLALARAMADAGFAATEMGPRGCFGPDAEAADLLHTHGLALAGAYVPVALAGSEAAVAQSLDEMRDTLGLLGQARDAVAVIADEGNAELRRRPVRTADERALALDAGGWRRLADRLRRVTDLAAEHGVRASFHPHVSTHVESPAEIERVLESCDIALTLDTGHLLLAGGDPVATVERWGERIDHVHLKDVRMDVMAAARANGRRELRAWWTDVSCPLGEGDVDVDGVVHALVARGYDGWIVVEQDGHPGPPSAYPAIAAQQAANREWLEAALTRHAGSAHGADAERRSPTT
jgi:inosose dehydratase